MEEKKNRIIAALTVNAVILIVVLVVVVISTLIQIVAINGKRNQLRDEIAKYEEMTEERLSDLEYLNSEQGKRDLAFEYNYVYPD